MDFKVIGIVFILIWVSSLPQSNSEVLYFPDDSLYELDNSNFESIVFGKNKVWIIQFYLNWCGHCIETAPIFRQFASDIKTWKNVVEVGVVDCYQDRNVALCRNYVFGTYPNIQIFKPFMDKSSKGDMVTEEERFVEGLESAVVKSIEEYQNTNAPADWPDLKPLNSKAVTDVRSMLQSDSGSVILFVEDSNTDLGRKVILDLSSRTSNIIRRVLKDNNELLINLKTDVTSPAAVVFKIDKNGEQELLRFPGNTNSAYIRDQIFHRILGSPRTEIVSKVNKRSTLHMEDLEKALREMFYKEISGLPYIYGERLQALKSFFFMLKNYFPGRPPVMRYIHNLSDWVSVHRNISGKDFAIKLNELQTADEYLPEVENFVGCRGSDTNYRGYTCSVWTLFHTLTVQGYIRDEETDYGVTDCHMIILPNIKNYIKYFFSCEECVQNFFKMDQNIGRGDNTTANVVMWLWAAHNRVNKRLSGHMTEDPIHPKVQFPIPKMCQTCRLKSEDPDELKWDEDQVLRFLKQFYSKENIEISHNEGNPAMGLKFNNFLALNLLLWILQYTIKKMDSY